MASIEHELENDIHHKQEDTYTNRGSNEAPIEPSLPQGTR